jgi:hypothetical protein
MESEVLWLEEGVGIGRGFDRENISDGSDGGPVWGLVIVRGESSARVDEVSLEIQLFVGIDSRAVVSLVDLAPEILRARLRVSFSVNGALHESFCR